MTKQRAKQCPSIWLKAMAPGSVVSGMLIVAGFFGWSQAFSLQGFVLLIAAWMGGMVWAFLQEPGAPVDRNSVAQAADRCAELRAIGLSLETQLAEETASVRTEVQRTKSMVQEAVEGLNLSFHKLNAHLQQAQCEGNAAAQKGAARSGGQTPNDDIGQMVRCLQFEDIVTQSLSAADDHLLCMTKLNTMIQRLLEQVSVHDPAQLEQLKSDLEALVAARNSVGKKVVQESMAGGDIELF